MTAAVVRVEAIFGPMLAYADDFITQHIVDHGAHTRPELAFLLSAVRDGDRVFDLGAHIGTYTVPLAQRAGPSGRVLAVEGVAESASLLAKNVELNGLADRVEVRCAVIAPPARYDAVPSAGNTGATFFKASPAGGIADVVTIDALARAAFVPDVMKVDLEGLEAWALTTSDVVRERKPVIYAEVSAHHLARFGAAIADLGELFGRLGYRLFRNAGPRHAAHDAFEAQELAELSDGGSFFDVLAIHDDDRASALVR